MTVLEQFLVYIFLGAGTIFWLFFLTWEVKSYKGNREHTRWYEIDLVEVWRRWWK